MIHEPVLHVAMPEIFLSVCGYGWFNLCTLIAQCATGKQPHPAPQSPISLTQAGWGWLKPAINHMHSTLYNISIRAVQLIHSLS